jgi:hypothetical protein
MNSCLPKTIIALCSLFTISSCSIDEIESLVGGKQAHSLVADLSQATICEAYRVDDSYPEERKRAEEKTIHGFALLSGPSPMDVDSRKDLSRILTNSKTYVRHSIPTDCLFRPGIAFRFADGNAKVDLLVCFSCNELRYYLNGKQVGSSYFSPSKLGNLVKKLFPEDTKIQSIQ